MKPITQAVLEQIRAKLKADIPELQEVFIDFPPPNAKLKFPSVSIFINEPNFAALQSYLFSKDSIPQPDGKTSVKYVYGSWDFSIQLDVWCKDKFQRFEMQQKVVEAVAWSEGRSGISLQLPDYYNSFINLELQGATSVTTGDESQTGEWRSIIKLIGNARAIREAFEHIVQNVEYNFETPAQIEE